MKKLILSLLLISSIATKAQVVGPPVDTNTVTQISTILDFLSHTGTNLAFSAYGLYDLTTKKTGAGIAADYSITPIIGAALRLDSLGGNLYMVQGTADLKYPITAGKLVITPFGFVGVGAALSGNAQHNGDIVYVGSLGVSVHITKNLSVLAGYERWTGGGFNDDVLGAGLRWKF